MGMGGYVPSKDIANENLASSGKYSEKLQTISKHAGIILKLALQA
jgi:hypothetical protein